MGFLKRDKAPSELPDLALDTSKGLSSSIGAPDIPTIHSHNVIASIKPKLIEDERDTAPKFPIVESPQYKPTFPELKNSSQEKPKNTEFQKEHNQTAKKHDVHGEDYLEFSEEDVHKIKHEDVKSKIFEHINVDDVEVKGIDITKPKFFDTVLDDINGEIKDLGKLGDWYNNKFSSQDIVSNMKGYWEKSKADIIIQSFGAEYKRKIQENIKSLQNLEEEWRVIYFNLIKKEEEMKKVEQELKGTLAEFVDICKRKTDGEEKEKLNN